MSEDMKEDKYDEWAVDRACDTLLRAEEIKQDKKMMGLVSEKLKKKKKAISSIADLKKVRDDRAMDDSEEDASEE